jgi:L-lactate dehydrogenase complex protein LldG
MTQIHHRDAFLATLSERLGRTRPTQVIRPKLKHTCHLDVLKEHTAEQLTAQFTDYVENNLGAQAEVITSEALTTTILKYTEAYQVFANPEHLNVGEILLSQDPRLLNLLDLNVLSSKNHTVKLWDHHQSHDDNISIAEHANVGVVFAEQALVESGTVVLDSSAPQGRSISLLPEVSIFVIPQSVLMPRMTQACDRLHQLAKNGTRLPSCVNLISGPSSTADIELIKIVGVHGPMYACYLILQDK